MTLLDEILESIASVDSIEGQRLVIITYIEKASEDKRYIPAMEDLAEIFLKTGSILQGLTVLMELYELKKASKYAKKIVKRLYQYEEYEKAYFHWLELAKTGKDDLELSILEARLLTKLGKKSEAIEFYRGIIKYNPTAAEAYEELADIYMDQNNISEAEKYYTAIYEYISDYKYIRAVRLKLVQVASLKEVLNLEQIYQLENDDRYPIETEDEYYVFANVYASLYQYDKAIMYAEKALQSDRDNINYSLLLIDLYNATGKKSNLYKELTFAAQALPPLDPTILKLAEVAYEVNALNDEIIEKLLDYSSLINNYDDAYQVVQIVINYYLDQDDAPAALHLLGVLESQSLDHEYLSFYYAKVYEVLGLFDKAQENYEIAIEVLLPEKDLIFNYALLFKKQGQLEQAFKVAKSYKNTIYDNFKLKNLRDEILTDLQLAEFTKYKDWENSNGYE